MMLRTRAHGAVAITVLAGLAVAGLVAVGCSSGSAGPAVDPAPTERAPSSEAPAPPPPPASTQQQNPVDAPDAAKPILVGTCSDPVPAGAPTPPPLPVYASTCPAIAAAPEKTTITSSSADRKFVVIRPANAAPTDKLPVVFAWHWLNGTADSMTNRLGLQIAADQRKIMFVVPEDKGDLFYKWPMMASHAQSRVEEEYQFFDDMLACVSVAYPIQTHCVASMGISAGALFTTQLASARSTRLSSFVSLSGGIGDPVRTWTPAKRALPALVLWGGPTDRFPDPKLYIFDFQVGSKDLEASLDKDQHFLTECVHNCGHAAPPFEVAPGDSLADPVFQFILDHPYWTSPGASPYKGAKLPKAYPSWCAVGSGAATPRTGVCPD